MTPQPPPAPNLRRVVEIAQRAPSVHNTQPWRWRGSGGSLELYADRSRQLTASDPLGRNLVISCGTVLHHAQVAAEALGLGVQVARLPDRSEPDLLARLELSAGSPSPRAGELLEAIAKRATDRRRFTSWPVPDERLAHLAISATDHGSHALPIVEVTERFRAEMLVNRAKELQSSDAALSAEQARWVNHGPDDGVPVAVLPEGSDLAGRPSRFSPGLLEDKNTRDVEGSDGLIVFYASTDEPSSWLRAGEALSAMWLEATRQGFSVVPLSQVVEVAETRDAFRLEVLGGLAYPLLVVRVGWQAISRSELPVTPRRPVSEVLELA